jgi:GrpB-like predicted nucleotidyltransferase (UPF0157 family)
MVVVRGEESCRTHYIHIVEWNGKEWHRFITFRNYLIKHKEALDEYLRLKEELANRFGSDRKAYTRGKEDFIQDILEKAKKS